MYRTLVSDWRRPAIDRQTFIDIEITRYEVRVFIRTTSLSLPTPYVPIRHRAPHFHPPTYLVVTPTMSVRSWRVDDEITKLHSTPTRRRTRRASTRFARTTAGTSPVGCETTRRQCQAGFCSEPTFDVKVKSNPQMCPLSPSDVRKMPLYVLIINDVISLVY